jgi:prevent-host-death family protein
MNKPALTVTATEFKIRCLALIDEMNRTNTRVLVTKHGKPVAEISPARVETEAAVPFVGWMKGTVVRYDSPFDSAVETSEWDALK